MSLTYIAVVLLGDLSTWTGIEVSSSDKGTAARVIVALVLGLSALYGRYRAGGVTWAGLRK